MTRQTLKLIATIVVVAMATTSGIPAQERPAPRPAPGAAQSPVEAIIELVKNGMSETFIVNYLKKQNKPMQLKTSDLLILQRNRVSEKIINAMIEPGGTTPGTAPGQAVVVEHPPAPADVAFSPPPATAAALCPPPAPISRSTAPQPRRIAVEAFEYATVRSNAGDMQLGQGIRALLTVKMEQSGKVRLVEREKLKVLTAEQDLGSTRRVDPGTKAHIGRLAGADAILFGNITTFGRDDTATANKKNDAGSALCSYLPAGCRVKQATETSRTEKAVVAITLRLVDAETGVMLATAEARGEASRTSTDWNALAGAMRGSNASVTSSNFLETIIGEATQGAVTKVAGFLERSVVRVPSKSNLVDTRVAAVEGCTLSLSSGANDGVVVGDKLDVFRITGQLVDPETKEKLGAKTVRIGTMVISEVQEKFSVGQYGGPGLSPELVQSPGYIARTSSAR